MTTFDLLVDTLGFALKVVVSAADVQDRDGACWVAQAVRLYGSASPRLRKVWADADYRGPLADELRTQPHWDLEIVTRLEIQPTGMFAVRPPPLDRRVHPRVVGRPVAVESERRVLGRAQRGTDLPRHDPAAWLLLRSLRFSSSYQTSSLAARSAETKAWQ